MRLWFTNKNPEKLITHIGTNDIQKIFDLIDCYVKNFSKNTGLVSSKVFSRANKNFFDSEMKKINEFIAGFCLSKNLPCISHSTIAQNCHAKKKLHLNDIGISKLVLKDFKKF